MLLAVFSDVHANLEALEAVLEVIDQRKPDKVAFCGDVVGYGGSPKECLDLVRDRVDLAVVGNHDLAVATAKVAGLPPDGQQAALWHHKVLSDEDKAYLAGLPYVVTEFGCTFAHATPQRPQDWLRVDSFQVAHDQFNHFETPVCFTGHSHMPAVLANKMGVFSVRPGMRYVLNVGSVGQPRDHNPGACVAFFDTETFAYELVRVPYLIDGAARKIMEAGLPKTLANRIKTGH